MKTLYNIVIFFICFFYIIIIGLNIISSNNIFKYRETFIDMNSDNINTFNTPFTSTKFDNIIDTSVPVIRDRTFSKESVEKQVSDNIKNNDEGILIEFIEWGDFKCGNTPCELGGQLCLFQNDKVNKMSHKEIEHIMKRHTKVCPKRKSSKSHHKGHELKSFKKTLNELAKDGKKFVSALKSLV